MINTKKKTVCITGAGGGLGYALIKAFHTDSEMQVGAITRNAAELSRKLRVEGLSDERIFIIEGDITQEEGREAIFKQMEELPAIGCLIHNAGSLLYKAFLEISSKDLERIYGVNVFAPFMLTQKLFPLFEGAHIINISSVGGVEGSLKFAGLSAYSSSKAALNCLTEMWSEEFKDTDHSFNCLALGSVETDMFKTAFPGIEAASTPDIMAKYIVSYALEASKVMRGKIISLSRNNP